VARFVQFCSQAPAHEPQRVADHVDDAELDLGSRVDGLDCLGKAFQPVDAGDQDILETPVPLLGQNVQPELGPFALTDPKAKQLLVAFRRDFTEECGP
jgi:hypothetical protein